MAKYFLLMKVFSRGKSSSVTRLAAYRAGERILDSRRSVSHDYSHRDDIVHKEILLPPEVAERPDCDWARDRAALWNAAEATDRRNARLAREILVCLPPELTRDQRTNLARTFSLDLTNRYKATVDLAVHEPRTGSDPRHHHAHILMTTREVTPTGLGPRTNLELSGTERRERGLGPTKDELLWIRERWAKVANEALQSAGLEARIDHRSYVEQGLRQAPAAFIPQKVYYSERAQGTSTTAGDQIRARHRERVEAMKQGSEEFRRIVSRQKEHARLQAIEYYKQNKQLPKKIPRAALTRDEVNQARRERYQTIKDTLNQKRREKVKQPLTREQLLKKRHKRYWADPEAARASMRKQYHARRERRLAQMAAATAAHAPSQKQDTPIPKPFPPSPTAEESARNWLAFREKQQAAESSAAADHSPKPESKGDNDDRENQPSRGRDNDSSL